MKTEKLSLKGIKNVLSRSEMKNIMAGSGSTSCSLVCTDNGVRKDVASCSSADAHTACGSDLSTTTCTCV